MAFSFPKNALTAPPIHTAQPERHENVTVKWYLEVGVEREKMRRNTRKGCRELGRCCPKIGNSTHPNDAVRVIAKDIGPVRRQLGALDQRDGIVCCKIAPDLESPRPLRPPPAGLWCVIELDPEKVDQNQWPERGQGKCQEKDR